MNCPVCNAAQEWSSTCRRCRCDLELLWQAHEACESARRRALVALAAGRTTEALAHAERAYDFNPDERAAKLLAVCHWLGGNVQQAWRLAASLPVGSEEAAAGDRAENDAAAMADEEGAAAGALGVGVWLVREGWTWFYNQSDGEPPCMIVEDDPIEPSLAAPAVAHGPFHVDQT